MSLLILLVICCVSYSVADVDIPAISNTCNTSKNQSESIWNELKIVVANKNDDSTVAITNDDINADNDLYKSFLEQLDNTKLTIILAVNLDDKLQFTALVTSLSSMYEKATTNYIFINSTSFNGDISNYQQLATDSVYIGLIAGELFSDVIITKKLEVAQIYVIGFGLGGQIGAAFCRSIAKNTGKKIKQLIAVDPASPCFTNCFNKPISKNDATFVQVIHTDSGYLGMRNRVGHIDWFVNSGFSPQPGCDDNSDKLKFHTCCHDYSTFVLQQTAIKTTSLTGLKCTSYTNFLNNSCQNNKNLTVGLALKESDFLADNYGVYFVTFDNKP